MIKIGNYIVVAAAVGLAAAGGCSRRGDFSLKDYEGKQTALSDLRGKVVLLSFGALG